MHTLNSHAHWVNRLALSTDFVLRTAFHDHTGQIPASIDEKVKKAKERFEKAATVNTKIVERLVSASDDAVIILWDPLGETPTKPIAKMTGHQKAVNHVTFSPDGLYIASSSFDNSIKLWSGRDGKFLLTCRGHVAPVRTIPGADMMCSCCGYCPNRLNSHVTDRHHRFINLHSRPTRDFLCLVQKTRR